MQLKCLLGGMALVGALVGCGGATTEPAPGSGTASPSPSPSSASSSPSAPSSPAPPAPAAPLPPGTYAGSYDVPVPPELAAAATFAVAEINWKVAADGSVRLAYNLPLGLVGTAIRVDFVGTLDPATQQATLSGRAGTSVCAVTPTIVTCNEAMQGLLPIAGDLGTVASIAAADFAGPAQQRVDVAARFIGDPIGILKIDLGTGVPETGAVDDKGKKKP